MAGIATTIVTVTMKKGMMGMGMGNLLLVLEDLDRVVEEDLKSVGEGNRVIPVVVVGLDHEKLERVCTANGSR